TVGTGAAGRRGRAARRPPALAARRPRLRAGRLPPRCGADVVTAPSLRAGDLFAYDDAVVARYPTIRAAVVHAGGLRNDPSPPALLEAARAVQAAALERLQTTPLAELPSIAAWRRAFTRFGAKPTQHRNAAEALLRRLAKHGDVPTISTLVDIGTLVSLRWALPVA